jgi:hypothetical protein
LEFFGLKRNHLATLFSIVPEEDRIFASFQGVAFDIRRLLLLLHFWTGLPKEMKLFSNLLFELASEEMPNVAMYIHTMSRSSSF